MTEKSLRSTQGILKYRREQLKKIQRENEEEKLRHMERERWDKEVKDRSEQAYKAYE
jgi:hypothetical protein